MKRGSGLKRGGLLAPFSAKRWAEMDAQGIRPMSTFLPKPADERPARKAQRYTGPRRSVRDLVDERSGGQCEWPGCTNEQDHRHHRLDRGMGGRYGEMRERLNGAAWLLAVCFFHHEIVTNPVGEVLEKVQRMGWVLLNGQDARHEHVFTRHSRYFVLLDDKGGWAADEEYGE